MPSYTTKKSKNKNSSKISKVIAEKSLNNKFKVFAVAVLLVSATIWAYFGAKLQQQNSDQLINAMLFNNLETLKAASFPGQHTFLLKWPLFFLVSLFNFSDASYILFTVLSVLVTIIGLIYIIHKIESRPLIFGTICLALASCLMLVPTVAYTGALLPVSMAMLTTRNIEYLIFIVALACVIKATKFRSRDFILALTLFGLLFISDKLFFSLSIIAGLLGLLYYAILRRYSLVKVSIAWVLATILGGFSAIILALIINGSKLTSLVSANGIGPYGFINSLKEFLTGIIYAGMGTLTNMGANPAYAQREIAKLPADFIQGLISWQGIGYLINTLIFAFAAIAAIKLLWASSSSKRSGYDSSFSAKLAISMTIGLIALIGLFVASNHYYAVDARYLGLAPFTLFIVIAYHVKHKKYSEINNLVVIALLLIGIIAGGLGFRSHYIQQKSSLRNLSSRNQTIAEALKSRNTGNLVGDYWRVVPIKQLGRPNINVMSQANCNQEKDVLNSKVWQKSLNKNSFAYLLTIDGNITDYKDCKLNQVIKKYGRPNASTLINGNLSTPKELLLFYDGGTNLNAIKKKNKKTTNLSTVLPTNIDELQYTRCQGPTIINIVAHQDDDLLFINPDIIKHIRQDYCVRTIYLTAGDAGNTGFYYSSREQGAQAAYDKMLNQKSIWESKIVRINANQYITVSSPRNNHKISLIFMHLPDGNMKGQGFKGTGNVSLEKFNSGSVSRIYSIDKQSNYSKTEFNDALVKLFWLYQPSEFNTQSTSKGNVYIDHSDHNAVGAIATQAINQYNNQQFRGAVHIPINYYMGYPIHDRGVNLKDHELDEKLAIFLEYTNHDGATCHGDKQCLQDQAYGAYVRRNYQHKN